MLKLQWDGAGDLERVLQIVVNFQEPALDLPSADLRTMDHDANTYEKVVLNFDTPATTKFCIYRVAFSTVSATGVCSETGM